MFYKLKKVLIRVEHFKILNLHTLPLNNLNKEHIRLFNMHLINKRKLSNAALKTYNKVVKQH
jgi:hypothetical protein